MNAQNKSTVAFVYKHTKYSFAEDAVILAEEGAEDVAHREAAKHGLTGSATRNYARYRSYFDFRGADVDSVQINVRDEVSERAEHFRLVRQGHKGDYAGPKALESSAGKYSEAYGFPALVLDLDTGTSRDELTLIQDVKATMRWLASKGVPFQVFSSGKKGYHIEIPSWCLGRPEHPRCAEVLKGMVASLSQEILGKAGGYDLQPLHRAECGRSDRSAEAKNR